MKSLVRGVNWLTAGFLGCALLVAWLQPVNFLGDPDWPSPAVILVLVLGLLIVLNAGRAWLRQCSERTYRWLLWATVGLIIIAQLAVAINFIDVGRADAFFVRNQAIALAQGKHVWAHYFMIYPNNVNFVLLEATLIKHIISFVATPWTILNGLRFIWVDTGLVSGLYLLKRWRRWQPGALALLVIWLVSVPIYAYSLFAYTDFLVLPIMVDSLALLIASLHQNNWRRWLLQLLNGLLVAFGLVMKSNLIILWIAMLIIVVVLGIQHRLTWRQVASWLVSAIVTLALMMGAMKIAQQRAGYQQNVNVALPTTSWVAMSLNPKSSGQYQGSDFRAVKDTKTAVAKQAQTKTMISQRLQQMGVSGTIVHLLKKFRIFWATGNFDSFKLTTQWIHAPGWYQNNQRQIQFWLVTMSQVIYLTMLVQGIWVLLKRNDWPIFFISLTTLGLMFFHVILWEVEGRYALPILPGLMLLSILAGSELPVWHRQAHGRRQLTWTAIVLAGFSMVSLWQTSQTTLIKNEVVGRQGNGIYIQPTFKTLQVGQQVVVTMPTSGLSNTIQLTPKNGRGRVTIQLRRHNQLIKRWTGTTKQLTNLHYSNAQTGTLKLTIKNIGQSPTAYGAMVAAYNPSSGQITKTNQAYIQYFVQRQLQQPKTLTSSAVSVGCDAS
ncbi:hypothetical protein [Lactiplantibacillus herbarum]|uniref:hypothetical protein n=1 Tax=Lactiplantibacillus herbarum TaxID=1670446 RepID=UPI0009E565CB|nr:hypothetical protein [Lactiplantibacillus herbarum]